MADEPTECLHCGAALKTNAFGIGNQAASPSYLEALNAALDEDRAGGCKKCITIPPASIYGLLETKQYRLREEMLAAAGRLPLLSINNPYGWEYTSIGLVTAQSTTGTGMISELASAWTDFFGAQSNVYNNKIRAGEDLCKASLRMQAALAGGNAILGVDVDYAEVGGQRAMLMVCMTGTAVAVRNESNVEPGIGVAAEQVRSMSAEANRLEDLKLRVSS